MSQYDLGTARGKVVVDYQSSGAKKVQDELNSVHQSVNKSNVAWAHAAAQYGAGIPQLQKYVEVQKAVADAQKTLTFFEQNLASARMRSGARSRETAAAESMVMRSRRSLSDITSALATVEGNLPGQMAGQGSRAAAQFMQSFEQQGSRQARSSGVSMGSLLASGMKTGLAAGATALMTGLATVVGGIGYAMTKGFQRIATIDEAKGKLKALGRTADEVDSIMNSAMESVKGTAFALDQAATVAAAAIGAGIKPGQDLTKYLKEIADAAAITGTSMEQMGGIFNAVTTNQVAMTGDLSAIADQGIPIFEKLAEHYKVSTAELTKMVESGKVDAATFRQVLASQIGGAALKMGDTINGSIANVQASVSRFGASLVGPLAGVLPKLLNGLRDGIDKVTKWFTENQDLVVTFWTAIAKAALITGEVIGKVAAAIIGYVGKMYEGFGDFINSLGDLGMLLNDLPGPVKAMFGPLADGLSSAAIKLKEFGLGTKFVGQVYGKFSDKISDSVNRNFPKWYDAVDKWGNSWVKANKIGSSAGHGMVIALDETGKAVDSFTAQLEKFGLQQDSIQGSIEGSEAEFRKLLKTLQDKKAPADFVNQIIAMRNAFQKAGPGAKDLAAALDLMADKTADASTKSQALLKSLRELGVLPNDQALADWNKKLQEISDYSSAAVDNLYKVGSALVNVDSTINTAGGDKNAISLLDKITQLQEGATEVAASGQKTPEQAWKEAHDAMVLVLSDYQIFGDQAEQIIQRYLLTPHEFSVYFHQRGGDELRKELTSLFAQIDAAKKKGDNNFEFQVQVTGDKKELEDKVKELGGSITFDQFGTTATITMPPSSELDSKRRQLEDQWANSTDPLELPSVPELQPSAKNDLQQEVSGWSPLQVPAELDLSKPKQKSDGPWWRNGEDLTPGYGGTGGTQQLPPIPVPGTGIQAPNDNPLAPTDTGGVPGTAGQGYFDSRKASAYLDSITQSTGPNLAATAQDQGRNFAEAFAQGILDMLQKVNDAALKMAQLASEPLGQSPAPYGPLSGSGWTYNRGQNLSRAFAAGIVAGTGTVNRASLSLAGSSTGTLQDSIGIFLKDFGEFSDFMKHAFDFVSSIGDIAFNVLALGQQLSGGRLFPKNYVKNAQAATDRMNRQNRQAAKDQISQGNSPTGNNAGVPVMDGNGDNKQQIANYIVNKAMSLGYSRNQANQFLIQAFGESGLNPNANGGNQDGTGDVKGIFQFTPGTWGNRPGSMTNAKDNIDQYFALAAERGLTPENFLSGTQLGTQVSIGGPWHPSNIGALENALKGAQPYIDGYSQSASDAITSTVTSNIVSNAVGSLAALTGGGNANMSPALMNKLGLQPLYKPGSTDVPGSIQDLAKKFDLTASTYNDGGTLHQSGFAFDFNGDPKDMERFAQWIQQNAVNDTLQLIYSSQSGQKYGIAGGQNVGPGTQFPNYYSNDWAGHGDHVHGAFTTSTPGMGASVTLGFPTPVSLVGQANSSLLDISNNTDLSNLGLPDAIAQMAAGDDLLKQAVIGSRQQSLGEDQAVPILQHLDSLIADQNSANTPAAKANATYLSGIRDNVMNSAGLQEGPDMLGQVQNVAQGAVGIAQDVFGIIDSVIQSVGSANDIANTLARGVSNSEDIYKTVDSIQSFLTLAQRIAGAVGDGLAFASSLAGSGAMGDPSGGAAAASMALGAAASISQIVSSVISAVNAGIDLGQEVYRMATKYMGRALQDWLGLPGATDVQYLLDKMTGQISVYSSENPTQKNVFNTLSRELFGANNFQTREGPKNEFYIYQGPGQDPRDTMNQAMFAVKSSGVGVFGYDG